MPTPRPLFKNFFWFLSGVFFVASLFAISYSFYAQENTKASNIVAAIVMLDLAILVPAALFTALFSLIPSKGKAFGQRFWARAPYALTVTTALGLLGSTIVLWYPALGGFEQMAGADYEAIATDLDDNCSAVHEGVFENKGMRIERHGEVQLQTDKLFGMHDTMNVSWLSPCEYQLLTEDGQEITRVKISHANSEGYDCVFISPDREHIVFSGHFARVSD